MEAGELQYGGVDGCGWESCEGGGAIRGRGRGRRLEEAREVRYGGVDRCDTTGADGGWR